MRHRGRRRDGCGGFGGLRLAARRLRIASRNARPTVTVRRSSTLSLRRGFRGRRRRGWRTNCCRHRGLGGGARHRRRCRTSPQNHLHHRVSHHQQLLLLLHLTLSCWWLRNRMRASRGGHGECGSRQGRRGRVEQRSRSTSYGDGQLWRGDCLVRLGPPDPSRHGAVHGVRRRAVVQGATAAPWKPWAQRRIQLRKTMGVSLRRRGRRYRVVRLSG